MSIPETQRAVRPAVRRATWVAALAAVSAASAVATTAAPTKLGAADVRQALGAINRHAVFPIPFLEPAKIDDLLDGDVVKIREVPPDPEEPQRAIGYFIIDEPKEQVWIAALDPHFLFSPDMVTEVRLWANDRGNSVWYQHLDLPWPVADRHWLVRIDKSFDVAAATDGRVWEHTWQLDRNGEPMVPKFVRSGRVPEITLEQVEASVYTPVNHGAWVVADLPGGHTLLVYHVTTVIGGNIPDSWVVSWALMTLDHLLRTVGENAGKVPGHYDEAHEPVLGGNGVPIPPIPAEE